MPIDVRLTTDHPAVIAQLRASPTLKRALRPAFDRPEERRAQLYELALEEAFGHELTLSPADAAVLAVARGEPVVGLADLEPPLGLSWTPRVAFLAWLAWITRTTKGSARLVYLHERGDWPYEIVTWTFGEDQVLDFADFDGEERPQREQRVVRRVVGR
ncbi:MAG TPA: hypothetical protein PKW90_18480 [Myxococcota bacterium]|nr:hypothetical protein [Myxococcota bacterium]